MKITIEVPESIIKIAEEHNLSGEKLREYLKDSIEMMCFDDDELFRISLEENSEWLEELKNS